MKNKEEILSIFSECGALLRGHFKLRSGLHSNQFFQAALLLQYPDIAEKLCAQLAEPFKKMEIDTVISPAVGGLIAGQETAKALGVRAVFADKVNDELILKRGFSLEPGEKVLIAEDVITRGGRVQQTFELVKKLKAEPVGIAVIVDRSMGKAEFEIPHHSLCELNLQTFKPENCELCRKGFPIDTPGSKS